MPSDNGKLPSLAAAEWLRRPGVQAVFAALAEAGIEARAVGGCVRNALLGLPARDVDLACDAPPDDVMAAAAAAGLKSIATGATHGTVTLLADDEAVEVTTLREDVETFGRHARVAFTADWAADARRRDFTMNALYCDRNGEVFDPLGGLDDLMARKVRFIGDARARIQEDFLRILRFFRVFAEFGAGEPDRMALEACLAERRGLGQLAAERVQTELLRLLSNGRAPVALDAMLDFGILPLVLGTPPQPGRLRRLMEIERHMAQQFDPIVHLAALAVHDEVGARLLAKRLRLSRAQKDQLLAFARPRALDLPTRPDSEARAMLYRMGADAFRLHVLGSWLAAGANSDHVAWSQLYRLPEDWAMPVFPVGGDDVMALGVPAGPEIGNYLRKLEDWWIAKDFAADRDALCLQLQKLVAASNDHAK